MTAISWQLWRGYSANLRNHQRNGENVKAARNGQLIWRFNGVSANGYLFWQWPSKA